MRVEKVGLMGLTTRERSQVVRRKVGENSALQMALCMRESFTRMRLVGWERTSGVMGRCMLGSGLTIR